MPDRRQESPAHNASMHADLEPLKDLCSWLQSLTLCYRGYCATVRVNILYMQAMSTTASGSRFTDPVLVLLFGALAAVAFGVAA